MLFAFSRLHDKLKYLSNQLEASVLYNSLKLDGMVEKYGPEPDGDLNTSFIISVSLVMAAGAVAPFVPVSGAIALLSGLFGMTALFGPEPPDPSAALMHSSARDSTIPSLPSTR